MKTKFQGIVGILLLLGALPALQAGDGLAALKLNGPSAKPEIFERVEIPVSGVPTVANPFDPDLIALDLEVKSSSGNLRSIDPCQHLISSSFTGGSVRPGLYSSRKWISPSTIHTMKSTRHR